MKCPHCEKENFIESFHFHHAAKHGIMKAKVTCKWCRRIVYAEFKVDVICIYAGIPTKEEMYGD